MKTVVVNVAVNAADIDKPVCHSEHPMRVTPGWIKLFNEWKDKQEYFSCKESFRVFLIF